MEQKMYSSLPITLFITISYCISIIMIILIFNIINLRIIDSPAPKSIQKQLNDDKIKRLFKHNKPTHINNFTINSWKIFHWQWQRYTIIHTQSTERPKSCKLHFIQWIVVCKSANRLPRYANSQNYTTALELYILKVSVSSWMGTTTSDICHYEYHYEYMNTVHSKLKDIVYKTTLFKTPTFQSSAE